MMTMMDDELFKLLHEKRKLNKNYKKVSFLITEATEMAIEIVTI